MDLVITLSQILRSCVSIDKHRHICPRSQHPFVELKLSLKGKQSLKEEFGCLRFIEEILFREKIFKEESETGKGEEGKRAKEPSKDVVLDEV